MDVGNANYWNGDVDMCGEFVVSVDLDFKLRKYK